MTKKRYTSSVGPVISAISSRAGHPMPLRARRPVGGGATSVPPPTVVGPPDGSCASCALCWFVSGMMCGSLGLLGGVLDRVDDALGVALAGEQVHDRGVEGVADVLPVVRVEPLRDVRGLAVGGEHGLQV